MSKSISPWEATESLVALALRRRGVDCKQVGKYQSGCDVVTKNGVRCEVKFATYNAKKKHWKVNIHRWKKMTESECDFYVIALATKKKSWTRLYLVIPSPVKRKVIQFTWRTLLRKWHPAIDRWQLILDAEKNHENKRRTVAA
jgi:hypothetical protein